MPQTSASISVKPKRRRILFIPKTTAQSWNDRNPSRTTSRVSSNNSSMLEQKIKALHQTPLAEMAISQNEKINSTQHTEINGDVHSALGEDQVDLYIPTLFSTLPPIRDHLKSETSVLQDETVQKCLPLLAGKEDSSTSMFNFNPHGVPRLEREKHVKFLHHSLEEMSARYVGYDASRPWIIYWVLLGLCLLGEDVKQYRERFKP